MRRIWCSFVTGFLSTAKNCRRRRVHTVPAAHTFSKIHDQLLPHTINNVQRYVPIPDGLADALSTIRPFGANDPAYISLSSTEPNRYTGSEIVFRRDIARGARFKIVGASLNDTMLDDTYFLR